MIRTSDHGSSEICNLQGAKGCDMIDAVVMCVISKIGKADCEMQSSGTACFGLNHALLGVPRSQVLQDGAPYMARKAGKRCCDDSRNLETCGPQIDCFSNAWER